MVAELVTVYGREELQEALEELQEARAELQAKDAEQQDAQGSWRRRGSRCSGSGDKDPSPRRGRRECGLALR